MSEQNEKNRTEAQPMVKGKRLDFELLRILAILLVIWNHTGSNGFSLFTQGCSTVNYCISLVLAILSKIAVPLFFLISGGLLLNKEEPIAVVLKKRVLRMVLVLVLFSAVNYGMRIHWGVITEPSLHDFLTKLWSEGMTDPYWYLYTYLGLLLMLPFLRPMVQHMSDRAFMYLIALNLLLLGILPSCGLLLKLGMPNEDFWLPLMTKNGIYFILGYYLMHRLDLTKITRTWLLKLWLAAIAGVAVTAVLMTLTKSDTEQMWHYFERFTLWPTLAVYLTVCVIVRKHPVPDRLAPILSELGGCVFGIYLLEGMLRYELSDFYGKLRPVIHALPACGVFVLAVFGIGLAITLVLRRIPSVKKLL